MKRSDVVKDLALVVAPLVLGLAGSLWWPGWLVIGVLMTALSAHALWDWYHKNGVIK